MSFRGKVLPIAASGIVAAVLVALPVAVILAPGKADDSKPSPDARRNVHVVTLRPRSITEYIRVPCSVNACDFVTLSAEVAGQIKWAGPDEGDAVKKGQAIVKVDTARFDAAVARARASLKLAESNYRRVKSLTDSNTLSKEALDRAIAEKETAEAALQTAEIDLEKASIESPLSGRVERRYVEAGEYLTPGTRVADIVSITRVEVTFEIPERDISHVATGKEAELAFESLADPATGEPYARVLPVTAVADVADATTRTYTARVLMDNGDERLKPGMIGRARLKRLTRSGVLVVPNSAVVSRKGLHTVWVVDGDGNATERKVTFGVTDGVRVEITDGLRAGDRLVVEGRMNCMEGKPVTIVKSDAQ